MERCEECIETAVATIENNYEEGETNNGLHTMDQRYNNVIDSLDSSFKVGKPPAHCFWTQWTF